MRCGVLARSSCLAAFTVILAWNPGPVDVFPLFRLPRSMDGASSPRLVSQRTSLCYSDDAAASSTLLASFDTGELQLIFVMICIRSLTYSSLHGLVVLRVPLGMQTSCSFHTRCATSIVARYSVTGVNVGMVITKRVLQYYLSS